MDKRYDLTFISKYKVQIMGVAALMIYIYHQWSMQWVRIPVSPALLNSALNFAQRIFFYGVDIFFFLSGLGLIYAAEKYTLMGFYSRRLERVYLPFFIAIIIRALVLDWGFVEFLRKVFLVDAFFLYLTSLPWFAPAIIIYYLCFPLYYRFFRQAKNKIVFTFASLAVWLLIAGGLKDYIRGDLYAAINRIPVFLSGVLAGWFIREKKTELPRFFWLFIFCSLGLGLFLIYMTSYKDMYLLVPTSNCCIPTLLLALSSVFILSWLFSVLDSFRAGKTVLRIFGFFGKISFELYLMHEFLDGIIRPRLCVSYEYCLEHGLEVNLVVFICVLAAALMLNYLCQLILRLLHSRSQAAS